MLFPDHLLLSEDEPDQDVRDRVKEAEGIAEERLDPYCNTRDAQFGKLISCPVLHSWMGRHHVYAPRVEFP